MFPTGGDAEASTAAHGQGHSAQGDNAMNTIHLLSLQFCAELAATAVALALALACRRAETAAGRGDDVAATPRAQDGSPPVRLGRS